MDPLKNPFCPGAGSPPPELVGRNQIIQQARILLGRVQRKKPEKSLMLIGLRGVGKTVLLNRISQMAEESNYRTVQIEAHEGTTLAEAIALPLRTLLYDLDRIAGAKDKIRSGIAILRSFVSSLKITVSDTTFGVDVDPARGIADSGKLENDLPRVITAVAEAAQENNASVSIFIDELQYLSREELSALTMAMHSIQQRQLPLVLIGAGLPIIPALIGESKSYAERLFSYPEVGALTRSEVIQALQEPAKLENASFEPDALEEIFRLTRGYPYFIQEWGYVCWNLADTTLITKGIVVNATAAVTSQLDKNFFRVRFDRLTTTEKRFLRAMSDCGTEPPKTSDIADRLGVKLQSVGPTRASLIHKGMIYTPEYGKLDFTVPLFNEFMIRAVPELS